MDEIDYIDYNSLIVESMRLIMCRALEKVQKHGMHGEHCFLITFSTNNPLVVMPNKLRAKYPTEMTIVIQHQFSNLFVRDNSLIIDLNFSNVPEHLEIPFDAILSFSDPSMNFGLKFSIESTEDKEDIEMDDNKTSGQDPFDNVISLEAFRNKKDKKGKK